MNKTTVVPLKTLQDKWTTLADGKTLQQTVDALEQNGFHTIVVDNAEEAKQKALELLPIGSQVFTMTSKTLEKIGLAQKIQESGEYDSVKNALTKLDRNTQGRKMQILGSAPEYAVGSVHAVTTDGHVLIASRSGSQLPGYVYGADHVIWIVSTQKIVKNIDEGIKRIYEHVLPLESQRVREVYGMPESSVDKLLIFNRERPGRITVILVKEKLGF